MFVKLGQVLSTRPDMVPPHALTRLAALQDRADPVPAAQVAALIASELGEPPARLFAEFDTTPVAAASLAQVHRARLGSGALVAVTHQVNVTALSGIYPTSGEGVVLRREGDALVVAGRIAA